ncbi:MAG: hypothetical protein KAI73_04795 [Rhodospirillaceae bacterium]|nr:hypothetical protein [Rhodospirillaceae bacterium]
MGFAEIIGGLAFIIAMIALWLVSDVIKKVDTQTEKFLNSHLRNFRTELNELDLTVRDFKRAVKIFDDRSADLEGRLDAESTALKDNALRLEKKINLLDQSIPKRYRQAPAERPRSIQ